MNAWTKTALTLGGAGLILGTTTAGHPGVGLVLGAGLMLQTLVVWALYAGLRALIRSEQARIRRATGLDRTGAP